MAIKYSLLVVT